MRAHFKTALIYIAVFLFISFQLAGNSDTQEQFKETKLDVAVFDRDGTDASRSLKEYIGKKHNLTDIKDDEDTILDMLYYETVDYVLIIKEGYGEKLAAGELDGLFENYRVHDSFSAVFMSNQLDEYVKTVNACQVSGLATDAAITKAEGLLTSGSEVEIAEFGKTGNKDFSARFSYYFQYMPYIFISVLISSLCPVLAVMEEKDIKDRTNCSSVKASSAAMQIILGCIVFILFVWLVFMAAGTAMYGGLYRGRAWTAVLNSFVFTLISAGIAILISSFGLKDQAVSALTQVIGLGMSFLCGVFVPQEFLGDGVLKAAHVLPAYWYIRANNMLAGTSDEAYSSGKIALFIGIEAAFAAALFAAVIIRRTRNRKHK